MSLLKKWSRETFVVAGQAIDLDLRILPAYGPGAEFNRVMAEYATSGKKAKAAADDDMTTALVMPPEEFVEKVFRNWVRPAPGLQDEDGQKIETGGALWECGPPTVLVLKVLTQLQALQIVSEEQGKDSASPSTSQPAGGGSGASPATSTESEGGPAA